MEKILKSLNSNKKYIIINDEIELDDIKYVILCEAKIDILFPHDIKLFCISNKLLDKSFKFIYATLYDIDGCEFSTYEMKTLELQTFFGKINSLNIHKCILVESNNMSKINTFVYDTENKKLYKNFIDYYDDNNIRGDSK